MINQEGVAGEPAATHRRQQILDAALDVIAEHGFKSASIKRIAERAGLKSPALIYWYFKDKDHLLEALLHELAPLLGEVEAGQVLVDQPPEQVLNMLADGFVRMVHQPTTSRLMRVMLSESARHPTVATFFAERGPMVVLRFLERYFARQMELGRMRKEDPAGAARAFMGMLIVYALGRELFASVAVGFPPPDTYGEEVVRIFLNGMSAHVKSPGE